MWKPLSKTRATFPQLITGGHPNHTFPSRHSSSIQQFSTYKPIQQQSKPIADPHPKPNSPPKPKPETEIIKGASFRDLGATKTVKWVAVIFFSIAATVESYFWAKLLWVKFGFVGDDEVVVDGEGKKDK